METVISWLNEHMLPCAYKQLFGISCPMCGFQRSLISLLRGDVWGCIVQFPPIVVWVLTIIACIVLFVKHLMTKKVAWIIVIVNLVAFAFNWVYQNVMF